MVDGKEESISSVHFLKTDPKARYQGYTFYFREGFCWNNVLTTYMKCKKKEKTVQSTESMSFFSCTDAVPEYYLICLMNSRLAAIYVDNFINSTSHCTTGDAKLIPVVVPCDNQLKSFSALFDKCFNYKKLENNQMTFDIEIKENLQALERKNDNLISDLYTIQT